MPGPVLNALRALQQRYSQTELIAASTVKARLPAAADLVGKPKRAVGRGPANGGLPCQPAAQALRRMAIGRQGAQLQLPVANQVVKLQRREPA
jgi:hypothetical protein